MGKKKLWQSVKTLAALDSSETSLDLTDGSVLKWWLWVSTLETSHAVIGAGISVANVKTDRRSRALFTFSRVDGTSCEVLVNVNRELGIDVKVL